MPIDLYPNIAKVKRGGVYQNLPGFVQQSGDADIKAMIANSETNTTAQFDHPKDSYFILNDTLYQADADIPINRTIAVGTNCHVVVLGNDVYELIGDTTLQNYKIEKANSQIHNLIDEPITKFSPQIKKIESGFVNNNGVLSQASNYKTVTYDIPVGADAVAYTYVYVAGTANNYLVISAFDENDNFICGLNNRDVNPTTSGGEKNINNWKLPPNASYIKVTHGNHSTNTYYFHLILSGIFNYPHNKMVLNAVPDHLNQVQYFFNVPKADIGGASYIAFNGKFHFPVEVESYEQYTVTYDAGYTNRTILQYAITQTNGIDHNNVELCINRWNSANSISANAAYVGVLINFRLVAPASSTALTAFKNSNSHYCIADYCLVNGIPATSNYYSNSTSPNSYVFKDYSNGFNPMLGGRLCCLGDSLTGAYYKQESETWVSLIAKWNSMTYDNMGVSGCPIANDGSYSGDSISEKVDDLSTGKYYTHIFVMGGANDYNLSIPIGNNTDTTIATFKGAINHIIDKLTEKFPCAKIVFATTYKRTTDGADKPYADAMIEVCKLKSIPCLNNYENSGVQMQNSNWMAMYGADNTTSNKHLNAMGDLFVAPRFEHALKYGIF